jgi:hypothetical protein
VHAQLQSRQRRVAPGRQLAEDHERPAPASAPGERPPGRRSVFPADHTGRIHTPESRAEPSCDRHGATSGACPLPPRQHFAGIALSAREPFPGLIPPLLARRQVDHPRLDHGAFCKRPEQRLAVRHGDRRQDGNPGRHAATLPDEPGRKRLGMPGPGARNQTDRPILDHAWAVASFASPGPWSIPVGADGPRLRTPGRHPL